MNFSYHDHEFHKLYEYYYDHELIELYEFVFRKSE